MKTRDAPRLPFLPPSLLPLRFCVRTRPLLIFLPLPPERLVCPLLSCYLTIVTTSAAAGSLPVQELVSSEWALQKRLRCGGVAGRRRIIVATDCTLCFFFLSSRVTCQGRGKGREMCGCGGLVRNSCHCFRGGHFFFFLFTFVCTLTPAKLWPELNCAPSRGLQAHLPTHFSMNWDFCGVCYTKGLFLQLFFLCN